MAPEHRTSSPDRTRSWLALQLRLARDPERAVAALAAVEGDPLRALERLSLHAPAPRELDDAMRALADCDTQLLPWPHADYPGALRNLVDPPPVLAVRGDPRALEADAVAFVGSRAASASGRAVARRLACELASAGLVIVSGLARGIDAAAHEGALEAGGRTIAVQACGPDRIYPAEHRGLASRICEAGAVLTELPPGTPPRRAHFPLRNRLISALSRAVVVVEARERSGTLITARHALDQGVDVFAVPGPIDTPQHRGSNGLLRDGAWPLLEARDVLDVLGVAPGPVPAGLAPPLAEGPRRLLARLVRAPATRDELARDLGAPEAWAGDLLALELAGRVARDRDGRWRAVA